jgi:hypothetical protein
VIDFKTLYPSKKKSCEQLERLPLAGRSASTASAEKNLFGFIQAGEDRAIAMGSKMELKKRLSSPSVCVVGMGSVGMGVVGVGMGMGMAGGYERSACRACPLVRIAS